MASDQPSIAKLEEVAVVNPRRKVKKGEAVPFIEMAALPTNGRDISVFDLQTRLAKGAGSHFENGDTLLARITPCLENGKTAQVRSLESGVIGEGSTEFIVLCGQDSEDDDFIYYLTRSVDFRDFAIARMEGTSGRQRVAWQSIASYEFTLPSPRIRREAASFLTTLDDRIDNLRQTSATLEAIAQALFKSWFVDFDPVRAKAEGREPEGMDAATAALFPSEFEDSELGPIPQGWRVGGLGAHCDNIRKQAKPETLDANTPYIGLEHMPRRCIALAEWDSADGLASGKFWYQPGDVLFGKLRPYFHKVGIAPHEGVCSTDILVIRARSPMWFGFTAMHLSSDPLVSYATQLSNGAKMPRTNWRDLAAYKVAIPDDRCASAFTDVVAPIIDRIQASVGVMRTLAGLRDTLLPRLISGKLRLPEAEAEVEALA